MRLILDRGVSGCGGKCISGIECKGGNSNITNEEARYEEQNKEKALQSYFVIGEHADGCYEHTHRAGTCGREKLSILSDQNGKRCNIQGGMG